MATDASGEVTAMDPLMAGSLAPVAVILGGGAGLAALILTGQRSLLAEIRAVETRLGKRIDDTKTELRSEIAAVETRLGKRIDGLDSRVVGVDRRLTLLEGAVSTVLGPFRRTSLPEPTPDESRA